MVEQSSVDHWHKYKVAFFDVQAFELNMLIIIMIC